MRPTDPCLHRPDCDMNRLWLVRAGNAGGSVDRSPGASLTRARNVQAAFGPEAEASDTPCPRICGRRNRLLNALLLNALS
jgi:hypothetical protein